MARRKSNPKLLKGTVINGWEVVDDYSGFDGSQEIAGPDEYAPQFIWLAKGDLAISVEESRDLLSDAVVEYRLMQRPRPGGKYYRDVATKNTGIAIREPQFAGERKSGPAMSWAQHTRAATKWANEHVNTFGTLKGNPRKKAKKKVAKKVTKRSSKKTTSLISAEELSLAETYAFMRDEEKRTGKPSSLKAAEREFWRQIAAMKWPQIRLTDVSWSAENKRLLKKRPLKYWEGIDRMAHAKAQVIVERLDLGVSDFAWDFSVDVVGHGKAFYDRMMSDPKWAKKQLASERYGVENFSYMFPSKSNAHDDLSKQEMLDAFKQLKAREKKSSKKRPKKKAAKK